MGRPDASGTENWVIPVSSDENDTRNAFASRFGQETDPLAKFEDAFEVEEEQGNDPFDLFLQEDLLTDDPREGTIEDYESAIRQWREFMLEQGRHPACPNERHARTFVPWLAEGKHSNGQPNSEGTVQTKLRYLSRI